MRKITLIIILLSTLFFTASKTIGSLKAGEYYTDNDSLMVNNIVNELNSNNGSDSINFTKIDNPNKEEKKKTNNAIVSWYWGKFHGRLTSSGERYNMNALTAAHKTLPFGTRVKITNLKNGKEVIVRITDRGPFIPKREFDLSKMAFSKIADLDSGIAHISYEIL